MTDKERIRAEVDRLHDEYRGKKGDADVRRALCTVLFFIDSLQEEPVNDDLEKAIEDAMWGFEPNDNGDYEYADMEEMFEAGAQWKKEQIMKNAISMDVYYETEWDDIHKFLRENLDGEKVKLTIIKEE